jgi:hypothetical protein
MRPSVPAAVLAASVLVGAASGRSAARAADADVAASAPAAAPPHSFSLSLAGGSGGAPQGHLGLRFAYARGRFEAAVGLGVFIGDDPRTEDASGKSPTTLTHLVPSLGAHYVVLHRPWIDLAPGLGVSLQAVHVEDDTTRPSYDTIHWTWQSSTALRLDAEIEARFPLGDSWFASVVAGWGVAVAGVGDCTGTTPRYTFSCGHPPTPANAPPTSFAQSAYGQLAIGRRF